MAFEDGFNVTPKSAEGKDRMAHDGAFQVNATSQSTNLNDVDCEKHGATRESNPVPDLKRELKSRHLQMIAIGTGSFSFLLSFSLAAHC
jgi:amino acid transporter